MAMLVYQRVSLMTQLGQAAPAHPPRGPRPGHRALPKTPPRPRPTRRRRDRRSLSHSKRPARPRAGLGHDPRFQVDDTMLGE